MLQSDEFTDIKYSTCYSQVGSPTSSIPDVKECLHIAFLAHFINKLIMQRFSVIIESMVMWKMHRMGLKPIIFHKNTALFFVKKQAKKRYL